MKEKTLVVLAAGMGSRFGGLKQIEPVGPNGEIIADYSVYDAIRAGFTKVVFVIREENYSYFKENITKSFEDKIEVAFVFQKLEDVPSGVKIPEGREKMWGTTHAVLCAKDEVHTPFVMINGDDFYGTSAYFEAAKFLDAVDDENEYMTVNYPFYLASSKFGKVNRGLIVEKNGFVESIDESSIETMEDTIVATSYKTNEPKIISKEQPVSMNFFVFQPSVFTYLEEKFKDFIYGDLTLTSECFAPTCLLELIREGKIRMRAGLATSKWLGITYKEDVDGVKKEIENLIANGDYPTKLWE